MDNDLAQEAISHALSGNWESALKTNSLILKVTPTDIDALNRYARACAELGDIKKAKSTSAKVLKIDPFNTIANKSLDKWKGLKNGERTSATLGTAQLFLEEPGKTKIVALLHLGSPKVLAKLDAGDEINMHVSSHRISITTMGGKYIGRMPDDISSRLKKLIKMGNTYQACIKSTNKTEVKVFIRELSRDPKMTDIPSFSSEKIDYVSFTPPELVHKKQDLPLTEVEGIEEDQ